MDARYMSHSLGREEKEKGSGDSSGGVRGGM
jgi:hypothetical protein